MGQNPASERKKYPNVSHLSTSSLFQLYLPLVEPYQKLKVKTGGVGQSPGAQSRTEEHRGRIALYVYVCICVCVHKHMRVFCTERTRILSVKITAIFQAPRTVPGT